MKIEERSRNKIFVTIRYGKLMFVRNIWIKKKKRWKWMSKRNQCTHKSERVKKITEGMRTKNRCKDMEV